MGSEKERIWSPLEEMTWNCIVELDDTHLQLMVKNSMIEMIYQIEKNNYLKIS